MASRRRQGRPPGSDQRRASVSPDRPSLSQAGSDHDSSLSDAPQFYNTTFSVHRVSPLYLGKEALTAARLQALARRLRDTLVGDVVRGVEVGLGHFDGEDALMGRAGALEVVEMRWVTVASVLDVPPPDSDDSVLGGSGPAAIEDWSAADWSRNLAASGARNALHISLRYEAAECTALLLPPLTRTASGTEDGGDAGALPGKEALFSVAGTAVEHGELAADPQHFLAMPLLLLRMPAPLKGVVGDFLATTFDCRVSTLRLGTRSLVRSWESWIKAVGTPSRGPLAKDVVLSLGFHLPSPTPDSEKPPPDDQAENGAAAAHPLGLRSIDIIVPASELRKFVDAGSARATPETKRKAQAGAGWAWEDDLKKRRKLAGRLHEEGWEWRKTPKASDTATPAAANSGIETQPFTEALGCYLDQHLGLNLFHPGVRVTKIACGGFVMSEGRLKVFAPPAASGNAAADDDAEMRSPRNSQIRAAWRLLRDLVEKAELRIAYT